MIASFRFIQLTQLATTLLWMATIALLETPASGQIVRIRPGLGIHVNAPYANIYIGPRQAIDRRSIDRRSIDGRSTDGATPLPERPDWAQRRAWGRRLGLRRLRDPALARESELRLEPRPQNTTATQEGMEADSPTIATFPTPAGTTPREIPDQVHRFPNAAELKHLDNPQLFDALLEISSRLDASLANFKTGPGWQRYLRLPEDAYSLRDIFQLEDRQLFLAKIVTLRQTQTRFEQVAGNPDFRIIASQPSFIATLATLQEVTTRWDSNSTVAKTVTPTTNEHQETLPTPEPARKRHAIPGEHSILQR